jgi:hypothetical protein
MSPAGGWDGTASIEHRGRADYRYVRADGSTVWIHDRSKLVRDPDGTPLFVQA